jgi:two-component system OmpR family response regulator
MNDRARILIVDDDREIRNLLSSYLEGNGFQATVVANGSDAIACISRDHIDLVILDLMLIKESGLDVCRELRRTTNIPVIMLTALAEEVVRVIGFEVGADDYLTKPFSPRELLGRIRAVLRRRTPTASASNQDRPQNYKFAEWRLDTIARSVCSQDGKQIPLSGADFRLLAALLAQAGRVVSRVQLSKEMRGREFDPFDRSIDVRVCRLRQMLGDDARAPQIIKTIYGHGYAIGVSVGTE